MTVAIISPRQIQSILSTPSGALASGDQVSEIVVPTTGIYRATASFWGATAIAAPRVLELLVERQLPMPLQSLRLWLAGVSTAGAGDWWDGRVVLRGQVPDGLGGFSEQWSFLVRLRTALPLGETLHVQLTLQLLATILDSPQESIEVTDWKLLKELRLAL